jgi:4-hydroxy-3-methylbut-2-enyl diphosphate reductase IspH
VTRAQRYAQKFVRDGWHVLIFGDPAHKEVRGIMGWTFDRLGASRATIVERSDRPYLREFIDTFPGGFPSKIGVMAQTTHKMEDFARFVGNLMLLQREHNHAPPEGSLRGAGDTRLPHRMRAGAGPGLVPRS